ncbi:hypothetical protein [Hymenobacter persicinus]|uniref:Uncharacterized protein n=1 Tax=Hymenobacter persicinus TaxID=2025506 RepID=A0A4Q5L9G5_9BACT|nr:hypothetical protein [Hymenobacter persicinus]RYU77676.1 hypothetical protein EWM57_17275 [Hymenobacter persicinus]
MKYAVTSPHFQGILIYAAGLLLCGACNQQQAERHPVAVEPSTTVATDHSIPFQPISYRLVPLEGSSLLDSLRTLPRADSTLIKPLLTGVAEFDSATVYYRYHTFALGPNRAEVVAAISDFDGIHGKLQMLLFTSDNQWLTNVTLAEYFDGSGGHNDYRSVQVSPTTFRQENVGVDLIEKPGTKAGQDPEWLSGTTTAHYLLEFKNNRFIKRQLDSTYVVTPHED